MLSPILTGGLLGSAIGISLGAPKIKLIFWLSIGIVIWTIILIALAALGISEFDIINI